MVEVVTIRADYVCLCFPEKAARRSLFYHVALLWIPALDIVRVGQK